MTGKAATANPPIHPADSEERNAKLKIALKWGKVALSMQYVSAPRVLRSDDVTTTPLEGVRFDEAAVIEVCEVPIYEGINRV